MSCTCFSKNCRKIINVINKRTLLSNEIVKVPSLFLQVHDKFVIVKQRWRTQGIFWSFRKVFESDQYDFGLVFLSKSCSDKLEQYFYLDSSTETFKYS